MTTNTRTKKIDFNHCPIEQLPDSFLGYTIQTWYTDKYHPQYAHLEIRVQTTELNRQSYNRHPQRLSLYQSTYAPVYFSVTWQATTNEFKSVKDWYAPHIEIRPNSIDQLTPTANACKKLYDPDPVQMLANLEKAHAVFLKYECRNSDIVRPVDMLPEDYKYYIDDYSLYTTGRSHEGATVGTMARSEDEAKVNLAHEFINNGYQKELTAWMNAGQPIKNPVFSFGRSTNDRRLKDEIINNLPS